MDQAFLNGLDRCLAKVAAGQPLTPQELVDHLAVPAKADRIGIFLAFAEAYFRVNDVRKGAQYLERAWRLTGPTEELYAAYAQALGAVGDVEASRAAHKGMGLLRAAEGRTSEALESFDAWHYVYARMQGEDHYTYDPDILATVDRLAAPHRRAPGVPRPLGGRKLRIAHLVQGALEFNSVLMKIARLYAQHLDHGTFEAAFFFPDPESTLRASKQGGSHLDFVTAQGCRAVPAPEGPDDAQRLVGVAETIRAYAPDLLVVHAGLASFRTYFILSQTPAQRVLGIISGPPPQFAPPQLDHALCWTHHNLMEVPVDCDFVPLETELTDPTGVTPIPLAELDLPETTPLLVAGGRSIKFSHPTFWARVREVLLRHPEAWLVCIGPTADQLGDLLRDVPPRVKFIGWTDQYLRILARADVVLDTFPNGGAVIVMDAMALGKPLVSVENDYGKPYDQIDWMPAQEYLYPGCELVMKRGDEAGYLAMVDRLLTDEGFRRAHGERMRQEVMIHRGHPHRMVTRSEAIFRKVIGSGAIQPVTLPDPPVPAPAAGPRFTVLVPTYNQAEFLPACLESLRAQTFTDWEAVVVDDGSTDATPQVLADYAAKDPRIRPFRQSNGGVGAALNHALREAQGQWICWLSSDDLFLPETLATFGAAQGEHPEVRFFHGDFLELLHPGGALRPGPADRARTLPAPALQTAQFLHGNYLHGISICVQRSLFVEVGPFKPELRYAQDMDMWFRMSARTPLHFLDQRLCITRVHTGQGTHGFPEAGLFDSARACLDFLNAHPFEALFPHLNLRSAEGITAAVQATLGAALQLQAVHYAGLGPEPALLERLGEWFGARCPAAFRPSLQAGLKELLGQMAGAPPALLDVVRRMAEGKPVTYTPRDPLALMEAERSRATARGEARLAGLLQRYLDMARGGGPAPEAFLLRPTGAEGEWVSVLIAYLEAFKAGEPVGLIFDLHAPGEGTPTLADLQEALGAVAGQLGLERFPDIRVAEDAASYLEALRAYGTVHRLPFPEGRPLQGTALQQRLAERLAALPV
jgi:hypothetical protein